MTDTLPDPLVPVHVDLRNFGFMPLDVLRLRDSDLMALATGDEFKAAVALWCVAWHQVPAASLPDDDRLLARFSGTGPAWKKLRDGALRGFVACSDGRLYHAVIAEKAREAWDSKQAQRARTAAATAAREARRREHLAQRDVQRDEQRDEQREKSTDVDQGIGTGIGRGQGYLLPPDGGGGPAPGAAPPTPPPPTPPPPFDGTNADALNGKAVVALADTFELPGEWGFDAERLGFKPDEVLRESEKFRQYWTRGKGMGTRRSVKGWSQTWSNWLAKAAKDQR